MPRYDAIVGPSVAPRSYLQALEYFKQACAQKLSTSSRSLGPDDFFGPHPQASPDLSPNVDIVFTVYLHDEERRALNEDGVADYMATYVRERTGLRVRTMLIFARIGYSFLNTPIQTLSMSRYEDNPPEG